MDLPGLEHAPKAGDVFAGKYRIERVLGVGGMGYVLAATHLQLRERVAIKMLLPSLSSDPSTVERFLREGRAAVKIRSEHCVRVLDVAELPDHTPYMVMEYLEGQDLAELLEKQGKLPIAAAIDYVLEAAAAVAEAHRHNIVHRDLKPANLFLQRRTDGTELVKVLDFGISKMNGPNDGNLAMTRTSTMMGSPLYMSPEQLKSSKNVDERADQWGLGVILFELIAGHVPFNAETVAELGALVLSGETPWLSSLAPGTPGELSSIVATCLRRKPEERFANLSDFADAAAPFGTERARDAAAAIVRTLGMPTARAHRVSLASIAAQAPVSEPSMFAATVPGLTVGWGTPQPPAARIDVPGAIPLESQSSPKAVTLADSSGAHPPARRGVRWPIVVAPLFLAMLALGGVAFAMKSGKQAAQSNAGSVGLVSSSAIVASPTTSLATTPPTPPTEDPPVASSTPVVAAVTAAPRAVSAADRAAQRKTQPPPTPSSVSTAVVAQPAVAPPVAAKPTASVEHATSSKD